MPSLNWTAPQDKMIAAGGCQQSRRPRVRFANRTKVYLVPALADMTDDEIDAAWTSDEDTEATQSEIVEAIRAMRLGNEHHDDGMICVRGLEHMRSPAHLEQRMINKECVLRAVLDEQERQWSTGEDSVEKVANTAMHNSTWARRNATSLGISDAKCARRLHRPGACHESLTVTDGLCKASAAATKEPSSKPQKALAQQALPSTSSL